MSLPRLVLPIAIALCCFAGGVHAADAVPVSPADMHIDRIRPGTSTYLVYMHGAPGSGIKRAMLSTSTVARERIEGADAWVIEQEWEDESGTVHTARTVHSARDLATLAQTTTWKRPPAASAPRSIRSAAKAASKARCLRRYARRSRPGSRR